MNDYEANSPAHHQNQPLLNPGAQDLQNAPPLLQDPNLLNFDEARLKEIRLKKKVDNLYGEIMFRLLLVVMGVIFVMFNQTQPCLFPARTFLAGCVGAYLVDCLMVMFEIHYIKVLRQESIKMMVFRYLAMTFLTGWLIWGNVLYYNKENQLESSCGQGLKLGLFLFLLVGYVEIFKCFCLSLVICIMVPYLFYAIRRSQRPQWLGAPPKLIKKMYETRFNPTNQNAQSSCPICMVDFIESDKIAPLPCDEKHYFHPACIKEWLSKNNCCPLCKKEMTKEALEEQRKKVKEVKKK